MIHIRSDRNALKRPIKYLNNFILSLNTDKEVDVFHVKRRHQFGKATTVGHRSVAVIYIRITTNCVNFFFIFNEITV